MWEPEYSVVQCDRDFETDTVLVKFSDYKILRVTRDDCYSLAGPSFNWNTARLGEFAMAYRLQEDARARVRNFSASYLAEYEQEHALACQAS